MVTTSYAIGLEKTLLCYLVYQDCQFNFVIEFYMLLEHAFAYNAGIQCKQGKLILSLDR